MEYQSILEQIKKSKTLPVYFLTGDESFFIDRIVKAAESELLEESQKDFNLQVLYGRETQLSAVIEICREYPFMGEKKVVILKEAQDIKEWEGFIPYLQKPSQSSILFIAFKNKKPDGRSSYVKLLKDKKYYFEFKVASDYHLPALIKSLVQEYGLKIEGDAIEVLTDYVGNDLLTLDSEIQKVKINLAGKTTIKKEHIIDFIGISREFNVFELQKYLGKRQQQKTYFIIRNMAYHIKSNPLIPTIAALYSYFTKVWLTKMYGAQKDDALAGILKLQFSSYIKDFREAASNYELNSLEEIINILHSYDLKAKGVDAGHTKEEDLLIEMGLFINNV